MARHPCVYLLASTYLGTLYIGITSDLSARLHQHRTGAVKGFTSRYEAFRFVHYEFFADMPTAIAREKQLKRWPREWKCNLIERDNPGWNDLAPVLGLSESLAPSRTLDPESSSG